MNSGITFCSVCGSSEVSTFFELKAMPVFSNIMYQSKEFALNCIKGDIKLAVCSQCGYIGNTAFDPRLVKYEQERYENPLDYSSQHQNYSLNLSKKLIERYNLRQKNIIEIGSGSSKFLSMICKLGNNHGIGFDPTYVKKIGFESNSLVTFIKDYYSQKYSNLPVDLIICKQTLEHIYDPKDFLLKLRDTIGNKISVQIFFEVPNAVNLFAKGSCWDILYEHISYFSHDSLAAAFAAAKFNICEISEAFEGQFLCVYGQPSDIQQNTSIKRNCEFIGNHVSKFDKCWQKKVRFFANKLEQIRRDKQRCVIWGAGSKTTTFLNVLKESPIEYVVDVNPNKQDNFIAGTGQRIVPPEFLLKYKPDIIILMNPVYRKEVQSAVGKLGISPLILGA
jgi:hypothetical protein